MKPDGAMTTSCVSVVASWIKAAKIAPLGTKQRGKGKTFSSPRNSSQCSAIASIAILFKAIAYPAVV
eukprot:4602768-Amphidinium_carterae.1